MESENREYNAANIGRPEKPALVAVVSEELAFRSMVATPALQRRDKKICLKDGIVIVSFFDIQDNKKGVLFFMS